MSRRKRNKGNRGKRITNDRLKKEDEFLRDIRSSNGSTAMCSEGFRKPKVNRFVAHDSKKFDPSPKISIRELADLMYDKDNEKPNAPKDRPPF